MRGNVAVSLFKPVVLLDVMQIIPADNDGALHLGGEHNAILQNSSPNADLSRERAFLVDVLPFDGCPWSLEPHADVLGPSSLLHSSLLVSVTDVHKRNMRLFLKATF